MLTMLCLPGWHVCPVLLPPLPVCFGNDHALTSEKKSRRRQAIITGASSKEAACGCCPICTSLGQQPLTSCYV